MDASLDTLVEAIRTKSLADILFEPFLHKVRVDADAWTEILRFSGVWERAYLDAAQSDFSQYQKAGTAHACAEDIASSRLLLDVTTSMRDEQHGLYDAALCVRDGIHTGLMKVALKRSGLAEAMIKEGKQGKKLIVAETSSRLGPLLTFPGSSEYLHAIIIPYSREARMTLQEPQAALTVSAEQAEQSALSYQKLFATAYTLFETSAAPTQKVPRSGKKPSYFIHGIGKNTTSMHEIIDTPLREHFDARVREAMYHSLAAIYGVDL